MHKIHFYKSNAIESTSKQPYISDCSLNKNVYDMKMITYFMFLKCNDFTTNNKITTI